LLVHDGLLHKGTLRSADHRLASMRAPWLAEVRSAAWIPVGLRTKLRVDAGSSD